MTESTFDALVIGAGMAGMNQLRLLRDQGLTVRGVDRGGGFGGTWWHNTYPGCCCDIAALDYNLRFDEELTKSFKWSKRYATQAELSKYWNMLAEKHGLGEHFDFNQSVVSCTWDEDAKRWVSVTDCGTIYNTQFVVFATGALSQPQIPPIADMDAFDGSIVYTHSWPKEGELELQGKRIGVIGTGSSGVQVVPQLAKVASKLTVFQRTAGYVVNKADGPIPDEIREEYYADLGATNEALENSVFGVPPITWNPRENPLLKKKFADKTEEEKLESLEAVWQFGGFAFITSSADVATNVEADEHAAEFVRNKIREIVADPATAELLCPTIPLGQKRFPISDDYYPTFNLPNVQLVSVADNAVARMAPGGVVLQDGTEVELDLLVLATGFETVTGALLAVDVRGEGGVSIQDKWEAAPCTYLGIIVPGFPNLFTITGPQSPSVYCSMTASTEQHTELAASIIAGAVAKGAAVVSAPEASCDSWQVDNLALSSHVLIARPEACRSWYWYKTGKLEGKPQVFLPFTAGLGVYRRICDTLLADDFAGFEFDGVMSKPYVLPALEAEGKLPPQAEAKGEE